VTTGIRSDINWIGDRSKKLNRRTIEMKQMMACPLAEITTEIGTNQAKTHATLRELRASQELLKEEMLAKLNVHYGKMMARMDPQLEKMEATVLEAEP
jgi:hypothetical protein